MPIPEYTPVIWLHGHCWSLIGLRKTSLEKRSHKASTYRSSQKWVFHVILRNYCENLMSTLDTCSGMLACCNKCHSQKHLREGEGTFRPILLGHSSSQVEVRAGNHARTKAEIMEEGLSSDSVLPRPLTTFPRVPLPIVAWALTSINNQSNPPNTWPLTNIMWASHWDSRFPGDSCFCVKVPTTVAPKFKNLMIKTSISDWHSTSFQQTNKNWLSFTFLKNQETYVISLV